VTDRSGDAGKWSRRRFVEVFPGVDGVDNQEVEDMFAGVWGDEGEERAALEAEAGESRGPGRGVKGFG